MKLIVGLKERGVLRVATGYLGASWLVIEIGHTLFNVFELPHMPLQLVAILLVLGFPVALALAWYYRPTIPDAPAREGGSHSAAGHSGTSHNLVTIAAVCVALLAVAVAIGYRFLSIGTEGHGSHGAHDAHSP